jgi:putative ABC transport system ATP-binding protein
MKPSIRIEGLEVSRARSEFVLRVPSLEVLAGERVALTGPSGSGKTTLLHALAGLVSIRAGRVEVMDHALHAMGESARRRLRRQRLGIVFQTGALIPYLTVDENLSLPHRLNHVLGGAGATARRRAMLLKRVGLERMGRRLPGEMSGGEQQRVAVCRALLLEPEVVLADEPTASLDAESGEVVARLLVEETSERGATLVCATHDEVLLRHLDRMVRLERGGIAS